MSSIIGSAPPKPPKPDPVTQATQVDASAKRQWELEKRKRGQYSAFHSSGDSMGNAGPQTLG
jgi:hypothetical protein